VPVLLRPSVYSETCVEGLGSKNRTTEGFAAGLCWSLRTRALRRAEFPSWSWTGWIGVVEGLDERHSPFLGQYYSGYLSLKGAGINIWVQLANGNMVEWQSFKPMLDSHPSAFSHSLHIEAATLELKFEKVRAEFYAQFKDECGCSFLFRLYLLRYPKLDPDLHDRLLSETWTGMVMANIERASRESSEEETTCDSQGAFVLLIDQADDTAERIGHLNLGLFETYN
jgi:hypothetical protein